MNKNRQERIVAANKALEENGIMPIWFRESPQKIGWLEVGTKYGVRPVHIKSQGDSLAMDYQSLGMGSAVAWMVSQFARWIRDEPRAQLANFEAAYKRGLGTDKFLPLLQELGYENPKKTRCVICGASGPQVMDWYSYAGLNGPCCLLNPCLDAHLPKILKRQQRWETARLNRRKTCPDCGDPLSEIEGEKLCQWCYSQEVNAGENWSGEVA